MKICYFKFISFVCKDFETKVLLNHGHVIRRIKSLRLLVSQCHDDSRLRMIGLLASLC